jgi:hypothetical protein
MKRSLFVPCLALALLLGANSIAGAAEMLVTQPPPLRTPLSLSLDLDTQWRLDPSYRLFSGDRSETIGGVSATWDLRRLAGGTLVLGGGWHGGSNHASWAGGQEAALTVAGPSLSAALRWSPLRWLEPQVRLAADLARGHVRLTTSDGAAYEASAWSPGGSLGAGLRLRTGAKPINTGTLGIGLALTVEGGFHLGTPMSFDVARQHPAGDDTAADRLPAAATPVGNLGRSHPYLRISFALLI